MANPDPLAPTPIEQLLQEIAELRRRISNIEGAPRSVNTSLNNYSWFGLRDDLGREKARRGYIDAAGGNQVGEVWFNDSSQAFAVFGEYAPGYHAMLMSSFNGTAQNRDTFLFNERGIVYPKQSLGHGGYSTVHQMSSGTYEISHDIKFSSTGDQIDIDLGIGTGAGTTADYKVEVFEIGGGTPQVISSGTGITSSNVSSSGLTIPTSCLVNTANPNVVGRQMRLQISIRRASGANSVTMQLNTSILNYASL